MKSFGEKLKQAMLVRGMTQTDLSKETGIHQSLISYYCADKVEPREDTVDKLIQALDLDKNYFNDDKVEDVPSPTDDLVDFKDLIKPKETKDDDLKEKYYVEVTKDIKKSFKEEGLTDDYLKFNVKDFVETFMSLFEDNNYIADAKKAEIIFNKTSIDYLHSIENTDWNFEKMQDAMYREKALLEIRRPTKDIIYYCKMIQPIIDYLKQDADFIKLLELTKEYLDNKDEKFYIPKQSNIVKMTREPYKKYACSVSCYNLYGNKSVQVLNKEGGIWAKNKEDAKERFKNWLNTTFDTVTYKEKDIIIEETE